MKILFLSHSFYPYVGGIETNSELLAAAFTEKGHQVHLLTWSEDAGGKSFPYRVIRNPGTRTLFKEHRWADLVFENNPCFRLGWPALVFRRPAVIAINTWITRPNGKTSLRDKIKTGWWLKRCRAVIAVSDAVRRACWPGATVILNPYKTEVFSLMPEVERDANFVFLGRLVSDKGADQAIDAVQQLKLGSNGSFTGNSLLLTIIGDGPDRKYLEQKVASLELDKVVHFAGALKGTELCTALNHHRYILVPSAWEEPFGNVVLEGMACGCVPVASDGGGLPEAVGKAGLTFKRNNLQSFVDTINMLVHNKPLERQLRAAAPVHLAAHRPEKIVEQYLRVIEKALNP